MTSRYEVFMDEIALSSVNPQILIEDIQYQPAEIANQSIVSANRNGAIITRRYQEKTSVTIVFSVNEYNIVKRQTILQDIVKWARGSILETNDREGQMLRCICDNFPSLSSVKNWTESMSMTFSAYALPYWEEAVPTSVSLTGSSESDSIFVPGNAEYSFVECSIKANSAITSLTVGCADTEIILSGISVGANEIVTISYDENMILSIKKGTISLLDKRTPSSSDDLLVKCGRTNSFFVTASASVTATFRTRGCWL